MELHELVLEMKQLERRLTLYEEKYGILSQDFYDLLQTGRLARYDDFDETRTDFGRWKGIYETWHRRRTAYSPQVGLAKRKPTSLAASQCPAYSTKHGCR